MNKRKETAAKILELLDGLSVEIDEKARRLIAEKFLDTFANEISARQAEEFAKLCDTQR